MYCQYTIIIIQISQVLFLVIFIYKLLHSKNGVMNLEEYRIKHLSGSELESLEIGRRFGMVFHQQFIKRTIQRKSTNCNTEIGVPVGSENYQKAVKTLKYRYRQIIIASHMNILMKFPSCTENNDIKKLRELYDIAKANV